MAKFTIEYGCRPMNIKLFSLTDEQVEKSKEYDTIEDFYASLYEDEDNFPEQEYDGVHIIDSVSHFIFTVKDEEDNIVYETEDVKDYFALQKTIDEDGECNKDIDWEFEGIISDNYLVVVSILRGFFGSAKIDCDEFDINKLYILHSKYINDELTGSDTFDFFELYYQQGEGYNQERDILYVRDDNNYDECYSEYQILSLKDKDQWIEL